MKMSETFTANIVQFLLPDGKEKHITADLPTEVAADYNDMLDHGYRLETEILQGGIVSTTISNADGDIDIDLAPNDVSGKVLAGVVEMLKRKKWKEGR
jgi:hypothetical protein